MAFYFILGVTIGVSFHIIWAVLRWHMIKTTTILKDLDRLGHSFRTQEQKMQGTAVIAGGSIGGYLTARVLADYFAKVVIVETNPRLTALGSRVGQRAQVHIILPSSVLVLRRLFPNFDDEAQKVGATVRSGWFRWFLEGNKLLHTPEGTPDSLTISRLTFVFISFAGTLPSSLTLCVRNPSLEALVRDLVQRHASSPIEVVRGTVIGIQASQNEDHIESVSYRPVEDASESDTGSVPATAPEPYRILPADFFVDCTGPAAISVKALPAAKAGWGPYPRQQYDAGVLYKTGVVEVPESARQRISRAVPKGDVDYGRWDRHTVITAFTPHPERGRELYALQKVDGDRILLLHCGWGVDTLASTFSEFVEAVEKIHNENLGRGSVGERDCRWIFDVLKVLGDTIENVDDVVKFESYKMGHCQWYDFQKGALPANFAAIGDSRMRVNPLFGQGVTKLLSDVTYLNSTFDTLVPPSSAKIPMGFSTDFLRRATPSAKALFDLNRMLDYGYPSTVPQSNETLEYGAIFRKYWSALLRLCSRDRSAASQLIQVHSGVAPGTDLFHPSLAWKVLLELLWPSKKS